MSKPSSVIVVLEDHRQQIRELTAVGKPPVSNDEQIARLINVETWILCLNGTVVNEETDYKGKSMNWNQLASTAANALSLSTQSGTADLALFTESLRIGIVELKKIPL